ncbi:MAG TPA: 1-acyl-sn-glycerol-3-phosphate acyltransferase [Nitriliruptorales bacterium]
MPPRLVRRLLFAPAVLLLAAWAIVSLPVAGLVALVIVPFVPGRWRPVRILWFTFVYLLIEAVGLTAAFVLWVASGFGWKLRTPRFQELHYLVLGLALGFLVRCARWTFNLDIHVDERDLDATELTGRPPIVVLARHAGPGDSFLLVATLLYRRWRPRIVLKSVLQWDPLLDVMLNRLPCRFIPASTKGRSESIEAIGRLAGSMGPDDALVIFPEGGNFTESRRHRSIVKLEELGLHDEADRARQMRHVLAPRTSGALAAIEAAPHAEVVLVAHTGLEELSTPVDLWRGLPMDAEVRAKAWRVYPHQIPEELAERKTWLYEWWLRVDTWIVRQQGITRVPDAVAQRVRELTAADVEFHPDDVGG